METKVNKECVLRNVLEYCFNDKLKQARILKGFLSSCRKGGDLAEDVKVLRAVLEDDAVAYTAGTVSKYQLSRIRPIIEKFSSEMSAARQEIYNAKRRRMREAEKSQGSRKPSKKDKVINEKPDQRLSRIERKEIEKEFHGRVSEMILFESLKKHIKSEYTIFNIVEHYRYIKHTGNGWDEQELKKCLCHIGCNETDAVLETYSDLCVRAGNFEGFLEFFAYGIFIPSPSVCAANLARAAMEARLLAQMNKDFCSSLRDFFRWEPRTPKIKSAPAIPKTKKRLRSAK